MPPGPPSRSVRFARGARDGVKPSTPVEMLDWGTPALGRKPQVTKQQMNPEPATRATDTERLAPASGSGGSNCDPGKNKITLQMIELLTRLPSQRGLLIALSLRELNNSSSRFLKKSARIAEQQIWSAPTA